MWERGLKQKTALRHLRRSTSLPMWERGLKHVGYHCEGVGLNVAPHVGAWIETILEAIS